ncbi:MAG: hypothetical protein M0R68_03650, partial [Bacteroidetes bacterium]|nr:hypothetical protein [Bacteroidota bacterium]
VFLDKLFTVSFGQCYSIIPSLFLFFIMLAVVHQPVTAQPARSLFSSDSFLVFIPFSNQSGFSGNWNLSVDIPRFAAAYTRQRFRVGIVSPEYVRTFAIDRSIDTNEMTRVANLKMIAEHFRTRFIVTADIQEFSISRFMVSEVQLAGYEAFSAEVKIYFSLYDAAQFGTARTPVVYEGEAEGIVKDRGLGITLFGKRTDRTNKYFALDEIAFGSEAFVNTIIGEALLKCMDDLGAKLERSIPSLVSKSVVLSSSVIIDSTKTDPAIAITRKLLNGEIVMVDEDDVFISLGSADGIVVGDILPVFGGESPVTDPGTGIVLGTREERVGEVQVIEVRADHLCLALIVTGKGLIEPKHRVRKVFVR